MMKLKRENNLTEKRITVMMLQKGIYRIREQMNIYEMKITNDIRQDRSRGKNIWDNINKLRGKITDKEEKVFTKN